MSDAVPVELALRRAQAFNTVLMRHIFSMIETTKARGAPDGETLIRACEYMLTKATQAAEDVEL